MNSIASGLRVLQKKISTKNNSDFSKPVEKQLEFLKKFKTPSDDFERSYFQYKCQMFLQGKLLTIVYSICSLPLSVLFIVKTYRKEAPKLESECDAVFYMDDMEESLVPESLKQEFPKIIFKPHNNHYLSKDDIRFIRQIYRKYPFSWFLTFKNIVKISMYSYLIHVYNPRAIFAFSEYSFTSSILSRYCRNNGVEHINIMHGEKLLSIRDAFFRYDRCYVWEDLYKKLFCTLKADSKQFVIEKPPGLVFENFNYDVERCRYDFTYYLQAEDEKQLNALAAELEILKNAGFKVAYRPHPSHINESVRKIMSGYIFENPCDVPIVESLVRTKCVISQYSTVLYQAHNNNIPVVIDDITNPKFYEVLCQEKYLMLNKPHELLSTLIRRNDKNSAELKD